MRIILTKQVREPFKIKKGMKAMKPRVVEEMKPWNVTTHLAPVAFMASMVTAFMLLLGFLPCLPSRMCLR